VKVTVALTFAVFSGFRIAMPDLVSFTFTVLEGAVVLALARATVTVRARLVWAIFSVTVQVTVTAPGMAALKLTG
jgi:hypothetical protein